ncbi:HU family DNA-binding protein [Flavobacterium sp. SM2513]|uniref:HU family DNA-binding protein n=1 Tax=Flavobacterium sp. SM2513 TaxID=3424766 RepID=UPI003D7F43BA
MSIKLRPVAKKMPHSEADEFQYALQVICKGETDLEQLAEEISQASSLTAADCYGVLHSFVYHVGKALQRGDIVRLDPMGSFQIKIHGSAANAPEALTPKNIKKANVAFRPGKKWKKMLSELKWEMEK